MRQHPVQATIQAVLVSHREVLAQQLVHGTAQEPLAMQTKFAAGSEQSIHHQQPQHLLPTHRFAPLRPALAPELFQPQLPPQLAPQPATPEHARPAQLQAAQLHLQTVHGIGGNRPVLGKQTQGGVALLALIKDLQALAPGGLLLIVDLSQVQHRPLHRLLRAHPPVLDDAEIAVILAVLLAMAAAQKHGRRSMTETGIRKQGGRSSPQRF